MEPMKMVLVIVVSVVVLLGLESFLWALCTSRLLKFRLRHVVSFASMMVFGVLSGTGVYFFTDSVSLMRTAVAMGLLLVIPITLLLVSIPIALIGVSTRRILDLYKLKKRTVVVPALSLFLHLLLLVSSVIVLPLWFWTEDFEVWTESRFATPVAIYMTVMTCAIFVYLLLCGRLVWLGRIGKRRTASFQVIGAMVVGVMPSLLLAVPLVFLCPPIVPMTAPLHQWCGPLTVRLGLFEADAHMSYGGSGKFAPRMARALSSTYDRIDNKKYLINAIVRRDDPFYLSEMFGLLCKHSTPGADAVFRKYVDDERDAWLGTLGEEAQESLDRWNGQQKGSSNSVERR